MFRILQYALAICLWIYIILRAIWVPITHDEAYSYLLVKTNYIKALVGTANTHWLNSIGMKLGSFISDAPFFLRIFSILSWPLFAFYAIKISDTVKHKMIQAGLFILLIANPFLLDFFSLARGYALACTFLLISVWLSLRLIQQRAWVPKDWLPSLFFASLAVASNYTSFYFFMSFCAFYFLVIAAQRKIKLLWPPSLNWWWILAVGVSIITISNLLFIKLYTGDLEYGGYSDFVMSTFGSLVRGSMYFEMNETNIRHITYILFTITGLSIAYAFYVCASKKVVKPVLLPAAIVLMMSLLNLVFHLFFKTPYLLSRTTLIFYPCISILIMFTIDDLLTSRPSNKYILSFISAAIIGLTTFHFFKTANLTHCYEWIEQAETKKCFDFIEKEGAKRALVDRFHSGVFINYYSVAPGKKYSFAVELLDSRDIKNLNDSFAKSIYHFDHMVLLPPIYLDKLKEKGVNFRVLKQFPISGATVLRIDSATQKR